MLGKLKPEVAAARLPDIVVRVCLRSRFLLECHLNNSNNIVFSDFLKFQSQVFQFICRAIAVIVVVAVADDDVLKHLVESSLHNSFVNSRP